MSWSVEAFLKVVEGYVSNDWLHEVEDFQLVTFSRSSELGCSGYSWSSMASYWMCIY